MMTVFPVPLPLVNVKEVPDVEAPLAIVTEGTLTVPSLPVPLLGTDKSMVMVPPVLFVTGFWN